MENTSSTFDTLSNTMSDTSSNMAAAFLPKISMRDIGMTAGSAVGALALGKYAQHHGKHNVVIAGYILAGLTLGAGVTDLVLIKTKIRKDSGWDGLGDVIMIMVGGGVLTASYIVSRFLKK